MFCLVGAPRPPTRQNLIKSAREKQKSQTFVVNPPSTAGGTEMDIAGTCETKLHEELDELNVFDAREMIEDSVLQKVPLYRKEFFRHIT